MPTPADDLVARLQRYKALDDCDPSEIREAVATIEQQRAYIRELEDSHCAEHERLTAAIERLQAENQALRGALREIAGMTYDSWTNGARAGELACAAMKDHP